jgi:voltage-gated sodium channel
MSSGIPKANSLTKVTQEVQYASGAQKLADTLLSHHYFENSMGAIIVFNMLVMVIETDRAADESTPEGPHWTDAVGWVVLTIFVLELVLRLFVARSSFWGDPFNVFDFGVVVVDSVFSILGLVLGNFFPVSILRVCRLAKLARVSKVLRVFPELRIMMAGLIGSISAIFWGTVLLVIFLLVWSIIAVQFVHPLNATMDHGDCERCYRAFNSVLAAALTISQTTVLGDSWGAISVPLIEAHPITIPFFAFVFLTVGLGVLNLILGVVCNVFTLAHDRIVDEIENEKLMLKMETKNHLLQMCVEMDTDGSGELTKAELEAGFHNEEEFRNTLAAMDITEEDLEILWTILDSDRSGKISYSEFASQVYTMTSSDTQFMLAYIRYYVTRIRDTIVEQVKSSEKKGEQQIEKVEDEIKNMEREEEMLLETIASQLANVTGAHEPMSPHWQATAAADPPKGGEVSIIVDGASGLESSLPYNIAPLMKDDSSQLQKELRDTVQALRCSLDQQIATISTMLHELGPSNNTSNLLVVPMAQKPTPGCSRLWCAGSTPDERVAQPVIPSSANVTQLVAPTSPSAARPS